MSTWKKRGKSFLFEKMPGKGLLKSPDIRSFFRPRISNGEDMATKNSANGHPDNILVSYELCPTFIQEDEPGVEKTRENADNISECVNGQDVPASTDDVEDDNTENSVRGNGEKVSPPLENKFTPEIYACRELSVKVEKLLGPHVDDLSPAATNAGRKKRKYSAADGGNSSKKSKMAVLTPRLTRVSPGCDTSSPSGRENCGETEEEEPLTKKEVEFKTTIISDGQELKKAENEVEEYEVEAVLDYQWCRQTTQGLYKVKWQGWDESSNTWEPLQNLVGCCEKLKEFYVKRMAEREAAPSNRKRFFEVPPDPRTNFERRSDLANSICPPPCQSELEAFFERLTTHPIPEWKESVLDKAFDQQSKARKENPEKRQKLREQIMLRHVREKRREQLDRLKAWEKEINTISQSKAWLSVENDVDLEGPPRQMTFIDRYRPSEGIIIPDDPLLGCECPSGVCELKTERSCCPAQNGHMFPYTKFGRLRVVVGTPIYECNKRCACGPDCSNRLVQNGRKTRLCIYRTSNGCGWGVKTLENIKKGSFVVEYVGEVITSEEAEERGKKYDAEGRTYLFDLDFNKGQDNPYTVDAAHFGNVSHFINHSCDPNLAVFNVWIDCLDPDLPRLCLFAVRDIVKGEQLTFDYSQRSGLEEGHIMSEENQDRGMECRCQSSKCRTIMFV